MPHFLDGIVPNAEDCPRPTLQTGRTRKQIKAKKDRAEATVKKSIRQQCVERDGHCRVRRQAFVESYDAWASVACDGPSEWAHLHVKRRSQTRGQAPEVRHTTKDSLMLCRTHHLALDRHELRITALTRKGCDGPLKFTKQRSKWS